MGGCEEQCGKNAPPPVGLVLMVKRDQLARIEKQAALLRQEIAELEAEESASSIVVDLWPDTYQEQKETAARKEQQRLDREERRQVRSGWTDARFRR